VNVQVTYQLLDPCGDRGRKQHLLPKVTTTLVGHCIGAAAHRINAVAADERIYCAYLCLYYQAPLLHETSALRREILTLLGRYQQSDFANLCAINVVVEDGEWQSIELSYRPDGIKAAYSLNGVKDVFGTVFFFVITVLGELTYRKDINRALDIVNVVREVYSTYHAPADSTMS
jgi:hypothetical protein